MNIVNLTPHALNIKTQDGSMLEIAPSGVVARVAESREALGTLDGLAISRASYGEIEGLPDAAPDTIYVVSALVLARTNRADVFSPGPAIRDEGGRIIGADGLSASAGYVAPPAPPSGWHHPHASRGEAAPGYTPRVHPVDSLAVVVPLQSKPENVYPAWSIGFNWGDGLDDLYENAMLAIAPGFDFGYGRKPRRHPNAGRSVTEDAFNDNAGFSRWPGGLYDGDKLIAWLVVERADNTSRTLDRFELHVLPEYADRVKLRESYIYTVRVRPDGDDRMVADWSAPKPKARPSVARIQAIAKERGVGLAEAMKIAEEEA